MGAYLAKPKTEKISEGSENGNVSYGVSCMQGWRVTMEDAHTCMLDFDENSTLFAVYDGHGGSEVAQYVAKHFPEVLKKTVTDKKGEIKQSMIDSFLEMDQKIISEEGLAELKELAGLDKDHDEEEDLGMLEQEATMPLRELLLKMKEMKKAVDANEDAEDAEYWTEISEKDANEEYSKQTDANSGNEGGEDKVKENGSQNGEEGSMSSKNSPGDVANNDKEEKEKGELAHENKNDEQPEQEEAESRCANVDGNSDNEKEFAGASAGIEDNDYDDSDDDDDEEEDDDDDDDDSNDDDDDDDDADEGNEVPPGSDEVGYDSGTTAIVAFLHENQLTVANVGDSRCVLCRNSIALEMSMDHKPEDEHELNRIHKAGGKVTCEGRVNGGLNLSRALGDHSYKLQTELSAHEQQITAMPDVRQTQLTEADEFMVIACDGIWNVKGSQEVVDFVSDRLREQRKNGESNLAQICEELLDSCLASDTAGDGSGCDNMTCIVVLFNSAGKTDQNSKKRKLQSETIDEDSVDKRLKTDDS